MFAYQSRRNGPNSADNKLQVYSVFGALKFREKVWGFARYDRNFDPNSEGTSIPYIPFDPTASSHFILMGLDIQAARNISIIPNIEAVIYDEADNGVRPDKDIIPRITVYFNY